MGVLFLVGTKVLTATGREQVLLAAVLGLTAALAILTRADYLLLILPAAGYTTWRLRSRASAVGAMVAACLVPLTVWLLWSWTTYSALLPNTLAAKTNVEIPATELAVRGIRYLIASSASDWITLLAILAGIALTLARGGTYSRMWAWGVVAYLGDVVVIGGDFMAFRFLAVPLFVCVLLLAQVPLPQLSAASRWVVGGVTAAVLLVTVVAVPPSAIRPPTEPRWNLLDRSAVADERGYVLGTSDMTIATVQQLADAWPVGPIMNRIPDAVVARCGGLGGLGLSSGPRTHVVDTCGLSDRLLAEQPFPYVPNGDWRVGHFERPLPEGYLAALQGNDSSRVVDPQVRARLVELWNRIRS
jgi:arabinofuranosyltransferase